MHYVYAHKHPISEEIHYIGCGKEIRMFCKNRKPNHLIWLEEMLELSEINKIVKVLFVYEDRAEALAKEKEHKPERRLIAFELNERGVPRQGYDIVDESGKVIGNVTSGTMSPCLQKGIGMGYVPQVFSKSGSKIYIQVRKKAISATIVKLPFYKG